MTKSNWPALRSMASRAAVLGAVLIFSACGGGGDGGVSSTPLESATAMVGTAGGTVTLPSGDLKVDIPVAALASNVNVTVTKANAAIPPGNIGSAFSLSPEGTTFASPITVTVKYDPTLIPQGISEENLTLAYASGSTWVEYPTAVDSSNKLLIGLINHFSNHAVVVETVTTPTLNGVQKVTKWLNSGGCLTSGDGDYDDAIADLSKMIFVNSSHCLTYPYLVNGYSKYFPYNLENHAGLDFRASGGTPAYAVFDGTVVNESLNLDPKNQASTLAIVSESGYYKIYYLHCQDHEYVPVTGSGRSGKKKLAIGDPVFAGDQVCRTGSIGAASAHLHIEVKNKTMDPYDTDPTTAIGGKRCEVYLGTTFKNFKNVNTPGCDLAYIQSNTVDPRALIKIVTCIPPQVLSNGICVTPAFLPQTITFNAPATQTMGVAPPALSATSTSGLSVSFASGTTSVCTVSGSKLTLVIAGMCTINASQAGNSSYSPATTVSRSFAINPSALLLQTITFNAPATQTMGVAPPALSATSTSGLSVSFASGTTSVCTVSGSTLTLVAAGACTINASQAGNSTYSPAATVSRSFTINPATLLPQTVTFNAPAPQTMGVAPPAISATSTSGLPVSFASGTTSVCTVSGSALTLVAAGACTINASQAGNSTYSPAATVSRSFTINPATLLLQTITFNAPATQTIGVAPPALSATSTSGLSVSFASGTTSVCTVSGSALTLVAAGTCTINASQSGNSTYAAAIIVYRSLSIVLPTGYVSQGGMVWKPVSGDLNSWTAANASCSSAAYLGKTGWRLPTKDELIALVDSGLANQAGWFTLSSTWSSSPAASGTHYTVYLGGIFEPVAFNDSALWFVTCVRQSEVLIPPAQPDLVPQSVSLTLYSDSVWVAGNVVNISGVSASSTTTRIQILNSIGEIYAQQDVPTPALAANNYWMMTPQNFSLLGATPGVYTVYVMVDFNRVANQSNLNNDISAGKSFTH